MLRMFSSKKKGKDKEPNNDLVDGNAAHGPAAAAAARPPAEARAFPVLDSEESTHLTCMQVVLAIMKYVTSLAM